MILGTENIAACPPDICTQIHEGFNQHCSLNSHMQRSHDPGIFQWFLSGPLFPDGHQSGHLLFSNFNLFPAKVGQADIGNFIG